MNRGGSVELLLRLPVRSVGALGVGAPAVVGFTGFIGSPEVTSRATPTLRSLDLLVWSDTAIPMPGSTLAFKFFALLYLIGFAVVDARDLHDLTVLRAVKLLRFYRIGLFSGARGPSWRAV